jgi:hypothetical protein
MPSCLLERSFSSGRGECSGERGSDAFIEVREGEVYARVYVRMCCRVVLLCCCVCVVVLLRCCAAAVCVFIYMFIYVACVYVLYFDYDILLLMLLCLFA